MTSPASVAPEVSNLSCVRPAALCTVADVALIILVAAILLQGILSGTAEQREQAALAFGDIVERTSADFIKPFVTQITGPLIRIVRPRTMLACFC